ncbi:MAG: Chromate transport protein [Myxococcota bacterium]|nr:Chromate transport protein [Myxococcota bacterium]
MSESQSPDESPAAENRPTTLWELWRLFFRLGATSFGGPAAHIAMMREEVVARRRWLGEAQFLDLLGAVNLIPGPNSTEMAIHIGRERRGMAGLLTAGAAFILPAAAITSVLAWLYVGSGKTPTAEWLLFGVKPVMLAVIAQAVWMLTRSAAPSARSKIVAGICLFLALWGVHELLLLLGAGLAAALAGRVIRPSGAGELKSLAPFGPAAALGTMGAASSITLPSLFWVFLKTGSVLYGSGYVLLAFLRADLVDRLGWMTSAQLLDAIAVGQLTPGPVFTTATFIGYVLAGPAGAALATVGIFLPAFIFVALSGPLIPRIRQSPGASAFLDGVNLASLALMAAVSLQLARTAIVDGFSAGIAAAAALLLFRFRVNTTWLVLGGALAGLSMELAGRG